MDRWLPIRYREFYDFPRSFLVEREGTLYFFDSPFDDTLDDYGERYTVYRVDEELRGRVDSMPWVDLANQSERIGDVPTKAVTFDPTKRQAIKADVFDLVGDRKNKT